MKTAWKDKSFGPIRTRERELDLTAYCYDANLEIMICNLPFFGTANYLNCRINTQLRGGMPPNAEFLRSPRESENVQYARKVIMGVRKFDAPSHQKLELNLRGRDMHQKPPWDPLCKQKHWASLDKVIENVLGRLSRTFLCPRAWTKESRIFTTYIEMFL